MKIRLFVNRNYWKLISLSLIFTIFCLGQCLSNQNTKPDYVISSDALLFLKHNIGIGGVSFGCFNEIETLLFHQKNISVSECFFFRNLLYYRKGGVIYVNGGFI